MLPVALVDRDTFIETEDFSDFEVKPNFPQNYSMKINTSSQRKQHGFQGKNECASQICDLRVNNEASSGTVEDRRKTSLTGSSRCPQYTQSRKSANTRKNFRK